MPMSWDAAADAKVRVLSCFLLPLFFPLLRDSHLLVVSRADATMEVEGVCYGDVVKSWKADKKNNQLFTVVMAVYDIKISGAQNEKIAKMMGEGKILFLCSCQSCCLYCPPLCTVLFDGSLSLLCYLLVLLCPISWWSSC